MPIQILSIFNLQRVHGLDFVESLINSVSFRKSYKQYLSISKIGRRIEAIMEEAGIDIANFNLCTCAAAACSFLNHNITIDDIQGRRLGQRYNFLMLLS